MTRTLILTGAVLTAVAFPRIAETASANRVLTATIPASQLTHLDLTALDGSVDLKADPNPSATNVTISVALDPPRMHNFTRPVSADLAAVALDWRADSNILRVGLTNARAGNIEAAWTITVPARFSARVDAHDGSVAIDGLAGGVEADVNAGLGGRHGALDVTVPRGKLALTMGVGDIHATRADANFGSAIVRATVGDASLYLLGHEIVAPHAPGPGHKVSLDGKGGDTLSVKVSVGDVKLKIG
jgi:hypothetical protein